MTHSGAVSSTSATFSSRCTSCLQRHPRCHSRKYSASSQWTHSHRYPKLNQLCRVITRCHQYRRRGNTRRPTEVSALTTSRWAGALNMQPQGSKTRRLQVLTIHRCKAGEYHLFIRTQAGRCLINNRSSSSPLPRIHSSKQRMTH